MSGIVIELQRDALATNVRASDLLRKALVVARKLRISDMKNWIEMELGGYAGADTVPEYRVVTGEIRVYNSYNGRWLPVVCPDSEMQDILSKRNCGQSVAEIESLLEKDSQGFLTMRYSNDITLKLMNAIDFDSPPVLLVPEVRLHGIIDSVRTTVLDWALKLEEQGIIGKDLTFSEKEQKAAATVVFNIESMLNSQIQSGTTLSTQVQEIEFSSESVKEIISELSDIISNLQLDSNQEAELQSEISTIEAQLKSPKTKFTIVRESLGSIQRILEGAAGGAIASGLIGKIGALIGG